MTDRWTYMDGEWKPEAAAHIHIYDSHFMFGDAVFEMHRTFRHQHFLLDEHFDRLWASMRHACIEPDFTREHLRSLCDEAIERNPFPADEEYRFMINVSRGPLPIYHEVFDIDRRGVNLIVNVWPLSKSTRTLAHFYDEPADARVVSQRQVPSQYIDARVKNRSRMHYKLADIEASAHGRKAIPLLLDDCGFVCESTGANFIMVEGDTIVIPEQRNLLRGLSMQFLLKLARFHDIDVIERNFHIYDVGCADEAFFTGTFYNMIPCGMLNGRRFGTTDVDHNCMGPVTRQLASAWNEYINRNVIRFTTRDPRSDNGVQFDFVKQIRDWSDDQIVDDLHKV